MTLKRGRNPTASAEAAPCSNGPGTGKLHPSPPWPTGAQATGGLPTDPFLSDPPQMPTSCESRWLPARPPGLPKPTVAWSLWPPTSVRRCSGATDARTPRRPPSTAWPRRASCSAPPVAPAATAGATTAPRVTRGLRPMTASWWRRQAARRTLAEHSGRLLARDVVKPAPAQSPTLAGLRPNIVLVLTDDQGYGDLSAGAAPSSAGW